MSERILKAAGVFAAMAFFAMSAAPAAAYMGAGAGLSMIGSILSFLGVFLLMAAGFVWYPVKRMIKKSRKPDRQSENCEQS